MIATRASVDALLKEMYEGPVRNQLNEERITIRRIKRGPGEGFARIDGTHGGG